ncbi:MAG: transglycosylase SLT domain-containing protein [Rikenellaceae bacterium]
MTLSKVLSFAVIALAVCSCNKSQSSQELVATSTNSNELVVLVSEDTPGSFDINGETYGYQYELFSSYASSLGLELKYLDARELSAKQKAKLINQEQVDIVTSKLDESGFIDTLSNKSEVYKTEYVVVTRAELARKIRQQGESNIVSILHDNKVLLSSGFKNTDNYDILLDSLKGGHIYLSSRNGFNLIESIGDKSYDFLICEKSEAHLGCALVSGVEQIYSFNEKVTIMAEVLSDNNHVAQGFHSWLADYRNSKDYAMLNYMYFERGIVKQFLPKAGSLAMGRISAYDEMVRDISEREGLDWRFVSAVIYNESRFQPMVESHCGAKGLMQIMPVVSRSFNVADEDVFKPENNILLGVKLLNKIEASLKLPDNIDEHDKMRIVLACYNAGIGHVMDARNLAKKYGKNPDSWEEMSHFLRRKHEYASDEVVKCGSFRGGETMAFVEGVVSQYGTYCDAIKR